MGVILWVVTVCMLGTMALMAALTKMHGRSIDTLQAVAVLTVGSIVGAAAGAWACWVTVLVGRYLALA